MSANGDGSEGGGNDTSGGGNGTVVSHAPSGYSAYGVNPSPSTPSDHPSQDSGGSGSDTGSDLLGKLLDLDGLAGGSASLASGLIDINLDGETAHTGGLIGVVAGGEGLGDLSVNLNTDAIGDVGLLGGASGLLGGFDSLDSVLCDCILS